MNSTIVQQPLQTLLQNLGLSTFVANYYTLAEEFEREKKTNIDYLQELALREAEHRCQQRIKRLLKQAKLPRNKLLKDFDVHRIPGLSSTTIQQLARGDFIDRYENIIIFGNSGSGKTHLSIALGREWCLLGRKIYFVTAANLVQQLLQAKLKLTLEDFIKKLDKFEVILIDDISYIPYERNETDVLFQLLASRYEMRSILITSNLAFGDWKTIFKDEVTANATIDRLVHHSKILELNVIDSYRLEWAKLKREQEKNQESQQQLPINKINHIIYL